MQTENEKHEAGKLKQLARQAASRHEALRQAPATLIHFSYQVTATCPATQKPVTLTGPWERTWNAEDIARLKDVPEAEKPWNAPHVQLTGYGYSLGDHTTESGITLAIWHCPECGGHHELEIGQEL